MRILFHSADPDCRTGYGIITKEIIARLRAAGHYVRCGTKHLGLQWRTNADGLEIFDGVDTLLVNQMLEDEHFDLLISFWDIWTMDKKRPFTKAKHIAWAPVDTEIIATQLISVCDQAREVVAMTQHGVREFARAGIKASYIPLSIDTAAFTIKPQARAEVRAGLGLTDENLLLGSVGLNYGDDRKGFITLMMAFTEFIKKHPGARLFLHTLANERGVMEGAFNYARIAERLGILDKVIFPPQKDYAIGRIDPSWLADYYNAFDVFVLPTKGEGFGLPIVEAQACGIPVIVTATTSGPELCRHGQLIEVNQFADCHYLANGSWRMEPRPDETLTALEDWYSKSPRLSPAEVRAGVLEYDHTAVWEKHWLPTLARWEQELKGE